MDKDRETDRQDRDSHMAKGNDRETDGYEIFSFGDFLEHLDRQKDKGPHLVKALGK